MKRIIFVIILISIIRINAQDYYPLHAGNVWYIGKNPTVITEKVLIGGTGYYQFSDSYYTHYERVADGEVFRKNDDTSGEYLYLKLNVEKGAKWLIDGPYDAIAVLESKTDTVHLNDTIFYNCYRYDFHFINVFDADYAIWLAPGVGIVRDSSLDWGLGSTLTKAMINGKRIPNRIQPPEVMNTSPYNQQGSIPVESGIRLEFNFTLKKELIDFENIKIQSRKRGNVSFHFGQGYGGPNYDFFLQPDKFLEYGDTLTVFLSKNLQDYAGDHLADDFTFSFITESENKDSGIFSLDTLSEFPKSAAYGDFDLGDYDNDGDLDIVLSAYSSNESTVFNPRLEIYKNSNGVFKKTDYSFIPLNPRFINSCVKWLDFNNDGYLDLVYAGEDEYHKSRTLFYRNDKLSFIQVPEMELNIGGAYIDAADFDKDGYPDLAIWGETDGRTLRDLLVFRNNAGPYSLQQSLNLQNMYIRGLNEWVDLNRDGRPDLIKSSSPLADTKFFLFSDNKFVLADISILGDGYLSYTDNLDTCDYDNDGDLDLVLGNILLKRDWNKFTVDSSYAKGFYGGSSGFFDYNHDGYTDLFIIGSKYDILNRPKTFIEVYKNNLGNMQLERQIRFPKPLYVYSAKWADINKDNRPDLILHSDDGFRIYYNLLGTSSAETVSKVPAEYKLSQNYPNPFNPMTTISYSIPMVSYVELKVYDVLGREVTTLIYKEQSAGEYKVPFDGSSLPSGVYIYTLQAGQFRDSKKLLLLK